MEEHHQEFLPRQNIDTPCHQSEWSYILCQQFYFFISCVSLVTTPLFLKSLHTCFCDCRKDLVRLMMNKIFQSIETELNSLIALGDKIDSFNSLYMLVKMSHHVWTAENVDPASYLSTTLGNVLVTVKRNFDKCIVSTNKIRKTLVLGRGSNT